MPFTPFHMGPGLAIKVLLQSSFSLLVFGWSQIVMDLQPLVVMLVGEGHVHGFSHTFLGATLLALFSAATGKYLGESALQILGVTGLGVAGPSVAGQGRIAIRWWVSLVSAFIGTYSHVVLDAVMHTDVQPLYPYILTNDLQGLLSITALHSLCLYTGLVGGVLYFVVLVMQCYAAKNKPSRKQ
ncbi:hypothetical protein I6N98_01580 [Spongiibacter nanhainus]|uniref:LexA-binding, inner membrane-associated hydrolase n=1 Tax=Spongiibacter nanhainus TaxID=2794344 RepID=A0A7T4R1A1_9GAMM|nr:metal-dependent hydrolase [Spongiibacter nanhainus]QQD18594.1 hypothetical protein I6N98_01580 [Spongiibacter nanhainus]